jgi:hypothetical protein
VITAFKQLTPESWRSAIYKRTPTAYGDPVGPTIENLRAFGKQLGRHHRQRRCEADGNMVYCRNVEDAAYSRLLSQNGQHARRGVRHPPHARRIFRKEEMTLWV